MTKRELRPASRLRVRLGSYHSETRAIGPSLVMVVPLLLLYESAVSLLDPSLRNSAEMLVSRFVGRLPERALESGRMLLLGGLLALCLIWMVRRRPTVRSARWVLVEALALALVVGPGVGWLVGGFGLSSAQASVPASAPDWLLYLLSVGAGLWEELVFRLAILGGTAFLLARLTRWQRPAVTILAILISALLFALYHHLGSAGEPLTAPRFAFRAVAGILIGSLFAWRGLAVVVYMHVFYDLLCDLRLTFSR